MKILIFSGMTNRKLASKLTPFLLLENISSMFLLRKSPLNLKPIIDCNPPIWASNNVLFRELYRLIKALFLIPSKNIDYIIGIHYRMHSIFAGIFSFIYRKKCIFLIVENPRLYDKSWLYFKLLQKCYKIGVRGNNSKEYLISKGISEDKIFISHNVFEINKTIEQTSKEYDLIFIGSFNNDKRPDIFVSVVREIKKTIPDIKAVMLGDGDMKNQIERYIYQHNLQDSIHTLGHKSNTEDYIAQSKLLVMTSQTEGLPMVILEAMNYGVPCVVPNIGDITDIAKHNINSKVIDNLNIEQYTIECLALLNSEEEYQKLSKNSLDTVQEKKNEYTVESISKLWKEVLT